MNKTPSCKNIDEIVKVVRQVTKKSIKINAEVDPSIIAGMEMKIGSVLLDSSINSKLRNLKNSLKRGL